MIGKIFRNKSISSNSLGEYVGTVNEILLKELNQIITKINVVCASENHASIKFNARHSATTKLYGYPIVVGYCVTPEALPSDTIRHAISAIHSSMFVIKVTDCILIKIRPSYINSIKSTMEYLNADSRNI